MDDVTARLAQMLGAEGTDAPSTSVQSAPGGTTLASPTVEQAAAEPWRYTGRGPTGRMRNFRAMNDVKLLGCLDTMLAEANDVESLRVIYAEACLRGHRDPAALDAWLEERS